MLAMLLAAIPVALVSADDQTIGEVIDAKVEKATESVNDAAESVSDKVDALVEDIKEATDSSEL